MFIHCFSHGPDMIKTSAAATSNDFGARIYSNLHILRHELFGSRVSNVAVNKFRNAAVRFRNNNGSWINIFRNIVDGC